MSEETVKDTKAEVLEAIDYLLNLVGRAYDVQIMKHNTEKLYVCSSTFRHDGEYFTLAVKGVNYRSTFSELLHTIVKWKEDGKLPDNVVMGEGKRHPIETIIDMPMENQNEV